MTTAGRRKTGVGTAYDPLAAHRQEGDPSFDVLLAGTVFLDIIFTGLPQVPRAGTEIWAEGMGSCPGGIANLAVAASRLGLRTALVAAFGDDDYGDFCWRTLEEQEHVNLSLSRRFDDWHSPVTVSMSVGRDRSMVTHGHASPVGTADLMGPPPPTRSVLVDLGEVVRDEEGFAWIQTAAKDGALVFADIGWDATGAWPIETLNLLSYCHGFLPNAEEAMAYTRTDTPQDALYVLADRVQLAVVTNGSLGALAIDSTTGEEVSVPALRVPALDATGAGDVFGASLVVGTLAGWSLHDRLSFSALCSSLAVQQFGGSLAAPGWGDIVDWWRGIRDTADESSYACSLRRRYAFLEEIVPHVPSGAVRRAAATIARQADVAQP